MYIVIVKEQKPLDTSILCEFEIKSNIASISIIYNNMYFVCNLKKQVLQYPRWLDFEQVYKQQIIDLGYKF